LKRNGRCPRDALGSIAAAARLHNQVAQWLALGAIHDLPRRTERKVDRVDGMLSARETQDARRVAGRC
jgi:hypothetical protein